MSIRTQYHIEKKGENMEITIKISRKLAKHISSPHTFWDGCEEEQMIMEKVQKEIDKKLQSEVDNY